MTNRMVPREGSFEQILPAIRAVLAQELVHNLGRSRVEASAMLNLTPAAITQYLKGLRASSMVKRIKASERLTLVVSNLARKVAEDYDTRRNSVSITSLLDAGYQILALMSGEALKEKREPSQGKAKIGGRQETIARLNERLQAEQLAAQRSMGMAIWSKNELARSLFRQIASDSLRHADIVSSLIAHFTGDGRTIKLDAPNPKELEEIIREEETAGEAAFGELKQTADPAVRLLVESIEADEEKHLKLLRGLLSLGRR